MQNEIDKACLVVTMQSGSVLYFSGEKIDSLAREVVVPVKIERLESPDEIAIYIS